MSTILATGDKKQCSGHEEIQWWNVGGNCRRTTLNGISRGAWWTCCITDTFTLHVMDITLTWIRYSTICDKFCKQDTE